MIQQSHFWVYIQKAKVKVAQSCPTLYNPMDYIVRGIMEWVAFPFSRGSSQPRDQSGSPALQADSFPAEPQGKPKNTGVGSLSFFQQIFPTQESNQGLLHCRWIFYQLSYRVASLVVQLVKNPPAMQENWVQSLGWEDPLEKGKAPHSSILA